jgi:hypothetical protein
MAKVAPSNDAVVAITDGTSIDKRSRLFASVASLIEHAQRQELTLVAEGDEEQPQTLRDFIYGLLDSAGDAEEAKLSEPDQGDDADLEMLAEPPAPAAIVSDHEAVGAVAISTKLRRQSSISLMTDALIGAAKSLRESTGSSSLDVRLFNPTMGPLEVSTIKNLGARMLGEARALAVGDFVRRHPGLGWFVHVLALGGEAVGSLSLIRLLPDWASVIAAALILPTILINCYFFLIEDVVVMLLKIFDTWYMFANLLGAIVPLCVMLNDLRMVFLVAGVLPSMVWSLFADAMPAGRRRITTILGASAGVIFLIFLQIALYFNWMELEHVTVSVGAIHYGASGIASTSLWTVTLFYGKNLVTAIWYRESLTVLKSRIRSDKMEATGARIVQASHIAKRQFVAEQQARDRALRNKAKLARAPSGDPP